MASFNYKFYEQIFFYSNNNLDEYYKIPAVYFDGTPLPILETLFGQKARNIEDIDFIINKIKDVIEGKENSFFIHEEHSLAGFNVNQKQTKLIEIVPDENDLESINNSFNNMFAEEHQFVETNLILQLYLDWKIFLKERENMVYVRKEI